MSVEFDDMQTSSTQDPFRPAGARESLESVMTRAGAALSSGRFMVAEGLADEALHRAWSSGQFELMARITLPLQEARRQRRLAAVEASKSLIMGEEGQAIPGGDGEPMASGCYVVQAPNVAADARRIRLSALEQEVAVLSFACEPMTTSGLQPVAVLASSVLRTKIRPAKKMTVSWCLEVIDALSKEALVSIDRTRPIERQVEVMLDLLDALPESELLHQELAALANAAARGELEN